MLMATWWTTEAIPIPATSLIPLVLFPVLGVGSIGEAAAPFANPVIFLFMGGFMIAQAMERWELHRRIALAVISRAGSSPGRLVAGFMVASAFLSMWVSNTAVAVLMLPIALSAIRLGDIPLPGSGHGHHPGQGNLAVALLLGVAYGASIGGMGTPIGTPPNAILRGFMADEFGILIGFAQWMLMGVPFVLLLLPIAWWLLARHLFPVAPPNAEGGFMAPSPRLEKVEPMSSGERRVAWVFGATAAAWIFRPALEGWIPGLTDEGIAMGSTLVLFLLPSGRGGGERVLDWEWAQRIPWGILILFGGGLSLAAAISSSGLAAWIGGLLVGGHALPVLALLLLVTGLMVFLTELTSNTASAAAFVPILAGLALVLGEHPLLLTLPAALAASCAFMLPVATPPNAIVFGSGQIRMDQMVKAGFFLNVVVTLAIPLLLFVLLPLVFGVHPGMAWEGAPGNP